MPPPDLVFVSCCGFAHKVKAAVTPVKEERWVVLGLLGVSERTHGFESLLRHQI